MDDTIIESSNTVGGVYYGNLLTEKDLLLCRLNRKYEKNKTRLWIIQPVGIPLNLSRTCKDFAFRNTASNSKPTECIDICGSAWFWECLLRRSLLRERAILILGVTTPISIPSKTCKAATIFPFWYSYLPSRALASCTLQTYFSLNNNNNSNHNH